MSEPAEDRHKITVRILLVVASFLAFLSIFTTWIDRQALDTSSWVDTSGRLLEDKKISDALANYAIDQLYANVNVNKELQSKLPTELKPLSGPAGAGLRELAVRAAQSALQRPRFQEAWRQANLVAHQQLVAILEDKSNAVSTAGGRVVLDLRPLVAQLADTIGISKDVVDRIPPDVAQLEIAKSQDLKSAQTIVKIVKGLAVVFSIGTLLLFLLAAYLARGRRWVVVFGYGLGLIVAGIAALALRKVGGQLLVDSLASTASVKPAATDAFNIASSLLSSIAQTSIVTGVLFVIASFLDSPNATATRIRRAMAPSFKERPALIWSVFGVLVLVYLIANPPHGNRELLTTVTLLAIAAIGLEALSRKIRREFPDAKPGDMGERLRTRGRELTAEGAKRMRAAMNDIGGMIENDAHPEDARLERLEKLGELKQKGVLTEAEFQAEKERLLKAGEDKPS
ncbi:MAG: hypothetical protein QOD60_1367 [Solirubrobacterales bacterium]|jgi:hypothetical protein|nr:hypothetical protein [Solirubrobacterales bacterium]